MKRYVFADITNIIIIPLITYLLLGLLVIQLSSIPADTMSFVIWGILAGIVLGVKKMFSNRVVTIGIALYVFGMIGWFICFVEGSGPEYALIITVSFAVMSVIMKLMEKRSVKIFIGYGVMVVLICNGIMDVKFSKVIIAFAIVLFLNAVSETIGIFYSGKSASLTIIYFVVAILVMLMPVSNDAYNWGFVKRFVASVEDTVKRIVTEINYQLMDVEFDGIFHFDSIGYSDSKQDLSTGLFEQDIEQLMLEGRNTKRNLYLKGNVSNQFVNDKWETNLSEKIIDYRIDALMTLYAIFEETENPEELIKFMEIRKQKIIQSNIKTQSLFYPVKILDISEKNVKCEGDFLRASQVNKRGYSYAYTFVDIDYSNKQMTDILKNSNDIVYEEATYNKIYNNLKEMYEIELEYIPFETFCNMAKMSSEMADEDYMDLTNVSVRVKELAQEVAAGNSASYDVCKSLEKYMYQYKYNKKINVPQDVNILDWFLFEGKEGYCVHYATALALMLRSEGIPSRVVEGFLVDYKNSISSSTYSISSNTAHVWVEAYVDNVGWIRLEPTVVNALNANAIWYYDEETDISFQEEEDETISEKENYILLERKNQHMSWKIMLKLLAGMAVLVVSIFIGLFVYHKISIKKSNHPDVVFLNMLMLLQKRYFRKEESETLGEYFSHLICEDAISEEIKKELIVIKQIMEKYWYGNTPLGNEEIVKMKNFEKSLKIF